MFLMKSALVGGLLSLLLTSLLGAGQAHCFSSEAGSRDAHHVQIERGQLAASHLLESGSSLNGSLLLNPTPSGLFSFGAFGQGAEVVVKGTRYLADFHGHFSFLLDPNQLSQFLSGNVSRVPLLLQENVFDGIGNSIGPIAVRMDPDRVPPQSMLTSIVPGVPFPAVQDMIINIHVTIPNLLPGITLRNKISPTMIPNLLPGITLRNKISPSVGPVILRNSQVIGFPPQNDVYQLVEPIELEDVNNPGPVLATIQTFPLTVNPATP